MGDDDLMLSSPFLSLLYILFRISDFAFQMSVPISEITLTPYCADGEGWDRRGGRKRLTISNT